MSFITIDSQKCKLDGICALACPMGLIIQNKNEIPQAVQDAEKICVGCGHCISVCHFEALSIGGVSPKDLAPVKKDMAVSKEAMVQMIKEHRSVREFKNKPVPHDVLAHLIDATRWSPTAANLQPVQWLVIEDAKEVQRIAGVIAEGARQIGFNPAMLQAWEKGNDVFLRNAPHIVVTHAKKENYMPTTDCTIALTCFDMMAYTYGIGTCWAGVLMIIAKHYPPLVEALKIPEGNEIYGAMMIGYPKYSYHKIPPRKPANITWK